ncbi:oxidoreductase [Klebsiella michiganensis]|uniref:Oxidoreductase n=1 Tax=Klebsiella michiganensis TaxID=1134687 RepID=A0A7H4PG18_9ENTR|nr:oxidoreductase [Klebsiella michiganensis]
MRKPWASFSAMIPPSKSLTCCWPECEKGGVHIRLRSEIISVERDDEGYTLQLNGETVAAKKLVVASGGLSMPGLGASPFGYKLAEQFGLKVLPTRAGLVAVYLA